MPYIYATALPHDIVKVGRTDRHKQRAYSAQSYYVEPVRVLALWRVENSLTAERLAHRACAQWHVRAELYRVPADWLDTEHAAVAAISRVLGAPLPPNETPQWQMARGQRFPWNRTR